MPQDPRFPAPGEISDQDWFKQWGVGPNLAPGATPAVQPPPVEQSGAQNALTRYGRAAAEGAAYTAPLAIGTIGAGAVTGVGALPAVPIALGEEALGALGGITGQAAADLGLPRWAQTAAGVAPTLMMGGAPAVARGIYQLGAKGLSSGVGVIAAGDLAANIIGGAVHLSVDAGTLLKQGLAAAAGVGTAATVAGVRNLMRPIHAWEAYRAGGMPASNVLRTGLGEWGRPLAGAIGGTMGPDQSNALAPTAQGF